MSIERERYDGPIAFLCDAKGCHEVAETRSTDFASALAKAKVYGWTVRKRGDEWHHYCRDCSE